MKKINIKILSLVIALACLIICLIIYCNTSKCDHIEGDWIVDKEATLDSTGQQHTECTICGQTINNKIIPEIFLTQAEVIEKLESSVVKVICYDYDGKTEISQGSGFFIDNSGTFITNAHVVRNCFFIKIQTSSGIIYDVDKMYNYNGTVSDYAICRAKNCFSSNAVEFTSNAAVGDTVYALGYPNDSFVMSTTSGKITNTEAVNVNGHYYSNTAWIDHGSSGGILADAKGRVLGITSGTFANDEYAALKYQDFKFDVEKNHVTSKEPLEYFHTVDEVWIAPHNIDTYFDIFVDETVVSDKMVSYTVTVQLKNKYQNAKFILNSTNIDVTVKLDTKFKYKEVLSYGDTVNKTETDTEYLYFTFWNEDDMIRGVSNFFTSSMTIPYGTEYCEMDISYDVEFFEGTGNIIIYDKYGN